MSGDSGSHCRVIWPGDAGFVAGLLLTSGSQVQCVGNLIAFSRLSGVNGVRITPLSPLNAETVRAWGS
jgi:hypothetical protein